MNPAVKKRFTSGILGEITSHFGCSQDGLDDLHGFENFVYGFKKGAAEFVLRVGHDARRPLAQVTSELAWLEYLKAGGAGIAAPAKLKGIANPFVVGDGIDGSFIASVFERAGGNRPTKKQQDAHFFETYGQSLGRIHTLSRDFQPGENFDRPNWDSASEVPDAGCLKESDREVIVARLEEAREEIRRLPCDQARYGLIHQDPHVGNLHLDDEGRITFFDFDDCLYGHFAYDIAMVFFYAMMFEEDAAAKTDRYLRDFLTGYLQKNALSQDCAGTIPLFMKLREIDLYLVAHRSFDVETTDNEWVKKFMAGRRDHIVNRVPWMDLDFGKFKIETTGLVR